MKKELKDQVENCLKNYPETRNSDIKLTICIWYEYGNITSKFPIGSLKELQNLMLENVHQDNVKRIRAKFNEEGKYWPTDPLVAKNRRLLEKGWKIDLGYNTQESAIGDAELTKRQRLFEPERIANVRRS